MRTEHDLLGAVALPKDALFGVHTARAQENFSLAGRPVNRRLFRAFGYVKRAAAQVNHRLGYLSDEVAGALDQACAELASGALDTHNLTDALQGGAGTSTNMNVNEVLANRALVLLGRVPGNYAIIDPLAHVNLHQSTNDTYPTALRIAAIYGLRALEQAIVELVQAFQLKEQAFADVVKVGRTQLQDAVLVTLGREMGAYAEAFSRDRWRIYKCEERLRVVNLGGTAIGTGLFAPRRYIFAVVDVLRELTGIGLARAENLVEATQNQDALVEVSGILKALATNLLKVGRDLRLLASGPDGGLGELRLPALQAGSSIMPGKVNPVIPEAVCQVALAALADDQALSLAVGLGDLELNAFLPLVADKLLTTLDQLTAACRALSHRCVAGLEANETRCRAHVEGATATATALADALGYKGAEALAKAARASGRGLKAEAMASGVLNAEDFDALVEPARVMRLGSRDQPRKEGDR